MARKIQATIGRLMAVIAVCAVALTVLRYAPQSVICAGPLAGSLWGLRRGEKGFIGGVIGGLLTGSALGVVVTFFHYGRLSHAPVDFVEATFFGAILGIGVGAIVWQAVMAVKVIRYLAGIPRSLRLRAEGTAAAYSLQSGPVPPQPPRLSRRR
jgi:hypothetical protein